LIKTFLQVFALIALASAAPQRFFEPERQQFDPSDLVSFVLRSLSNERNPGRGRQGGGEGDLIRVLIRLVAAEFGLDNLDGRIDGPDGEVVIRNLIKVFTNVVGNALLR
jgi:hypothetical protein